MAIATDTRDVIFKPIVNCCNELCNSPNISLIFSFITPVFESLPNKLLIAVDICSIKPVNFLAAAKIPPPAKPANMSVIVTLSAIQVNTLSTVPQILLNTLETPSPNLLITPLMPPKESTVPLAISEIHFDTELRLLVNPLKLRSLLSDVKKSPRAAVASKRASPILFIPSEPASSNNGFIMASIAFLPMSSIENIPLNVLLNSSACFPVNSLNLLVSSSTRSVILYNCSPVIGGNISVNASLSGFTTLISPSKEFQRALIRFSLPDA